MAKLLNEYPDKIYLGKMNNKSIYLYKPSWNCNWYWGFGYLGNSTCHFHVSSLREKVTYFRDKDDIPRREIVHKGLFFGFKEQFDKGTFIVKDDKDIWVLCDLFETFYKFKDVAAISRYGNANITDRNPCYDYIKNDDLYHRINEELFPHIFDEIYKILLKYSKNKKIVVK